LLPIAALNCSGEEALGNAAIGDADKLALQLQTTSRSGSRGMLGILKPSVRYHRSARTTAPSGWRCSRVLLRLLLFAITPAAPSSYCRRPRGFHRGENGVVDTCWKGTEPAGVRGLSPGVVRRDALAIGAAALGLSVTAHFFD
jgi:hypothetical protein